MGAFEPICACEVSTHDLLRDLSTPCRVHAPSYRSIFATQLVLRGRLCSWLVVCVCGGRVRVSTVSDECVHFFRTACRISRRKCSEVGDSCVRVAFASCPSLPHGVLSGHGIKAAPVCSTTFTVSISASSHPVADSGFGSAQFSCNDQ